jgi:hypothetical protein
MGGTVKWWKGDGGVSLSKGTVDDARDLIIYLFDLFCVDVPSCTHVKRAEE